MTDSPLIARRRTLKIGAFGAIGTLLLTSCSSGSDTESGSEGPSVEWGSNPEQFQEALDEMDPVTLTLQAQPSSPEAEDAWVILDAKDRIEEYSNGKVTVEIAWANSIVPPTEIDDALVDGRIDFGFYSPIYEPSEYPANNALIDATFTRDPSVIDGTLQTHAALWEVAYGTPEVMAEFTDQGMTPVVPIIPQGNVHFMCKEPLTSTADFEGQQVRVSGQAHEVAVRELGASPVSLEFPETYEALQRGTVDCAVGNLSTAEQSGWLEVAPYLVSAETATLPATPSSWILGGQYSSLPTAAQQLIWDTMLHTTGAYLEDYLGRLQLATVEQLEEGSGDVLATNEDVANDLASANESLKDDWQAVVGEDFTNQVTDSQEEWLNRVHDLGYDQTGTLADFEDWYDPELDTQPWVEAVYEVFANEQRPS